MEESKGQFRCIHCGDRFDDKESAELVSEGELAPWEVDTCPDCCDMINHPSHDISEMHSDADSGL
jgi:hypothetical protein